MGRLHRFRWALTLEGLLDDELDDLALERVLGHLERCADCVDELELLVCVQQSIARLAVSR